MRHNQSPNLNELDLSLAPFHIAMKGSFSQPQPDFSLSIEDREIGGLGIHFVREFMDDFSYERQGAHNRVSLVKHLHEDLCEGS